MASSSYQLVSGEHARPRSSQLKTPPFYSIYRKKIEKSGIERPTFFAFFLAPAFLPLGLRGGGPPVGRVPTGHQLRHGKRRCPWCGREPSHHGFPDRPANLDPLPPAETRGSKGQPRRARAKSTNNPAQQPLSYRHADKRKHPPQGGLVDSQRQRGGTRTVGGCPASGLDPHRPERAGKEGNAAPGGGESYPPSRMSRSPESAPAGQGCVCAGDHPIPHSPRVHGPNEMAPDGLLWYKAGDFATRRSQNCESGAV